MKKLLLFLLLLPLGFLGSCSDDDDKIPDCDISVVFENVAVVDGTMYVTQDTNFGVQSMSAEGTNGKKTAIANVTFGIDYRPIGIVNIDPFNGVFNTSSLLPGNHVLTIAFDILQVGKSVFESSVSYKFTVVASAEDIPDGATLGTYTDTFNISSK